MSIIVSIALASICFTYNGANECHPVLLGKKSTTPTGDYVVKRRYTSDPGYGGDVLQFHETKDALWAIHRVYTLVPSQNRVERLKSPNVQDRYISAGCINVDPAVYQKLIDCCQGEKLTIE